MEKNKISVVIPVYNASKYLSKCLDSVINQSYSNIEIILVNDGSTDNSGNICDEYANKDKRIKVVHKENGGVSSARNTGIDNTTGEYVTFIDSDDLVHPEYIRILADNLFLALPVCKIKYFKNDVSFIETKEITVGLNKDNFIELCNMNLLNTPCCKLFDIDIIRKNKIYFDNSLSLGEDLLFNLEYLKYIDKITVIDNELYYYRKDDDNTLSSAYNPKMFEIQSLLFDSYTNFFSKTIVNDEQRFIYDSYRFSIIKITLENEFKNKNISFWNRYINSKKLLQNKKMEDMINEIQYPKKKFFYFLIKYRLVLIYKIINKIISKI